MGHRRLSDRGASSIRTVSRAAALVLAITTASVIVGCSSAPVPTDRSADASADASGAEHAEPTSEPIDVDDRSSAGTSSPGSQSPVPSSAPTPTFDATAYSLDEPSSIWVVVNKARALVPIDYVPPRLVLPAVPNVNGQPMRPDVAVALTAMFAAGTAQAGVHFSVQSAYRSYATQVAVYNQDVAQHGRPFADTDTARPGHSEHQTGLAVDISAVPAACSLDVCFGTTPQGKWLVANAWRFGFLLRYPADKVAVTGFTYEPWHFRYIGTALAAEMHRRGVTTLEEFFGVPGGTQYR
jgi:D-alanyl-D-alanine carboxypeptidase